MTAVNQWPKPAARPVSPCAVPGCRNPAGGETSATGRPLRVSLRRFGKDGDGCKNCYRKLCHAVTVVAQRTGPVTRCSGPNCPDPDGGTVGPDGRPVRVSLGVFDRPGVGCQLCYQRLWRAAERERLAEERRARAAEAARAKAQALADAAAARALEEKSRVVDAAALALADARAERDRAAHEADRAAAAGVKAEAIAKDRREPRPVTLWVDLRGRKLTRRIVRLWDARRLDPLLAAAVVL